MLDKLIIFFVEPVLIEMFMLYMSKMTSCFCMFDAFFINLRSETA